MGVKKFILKLLIFSGSILLPIGLTNYIIDPYQFFRKATLYKPIYSTEERIQNPGLIKNYNYNTILIGTSLSQNFDTEIIDSLFNCKSLRLTISGSTTHEQKLTLEMALKTEKVKTVFWEISSCILNMDSAQVRTDKIIFPFHLYDNHSFNDIKYIFDIVAFKISLKIIRGNAKDEFTDNLKLLNYWGDCPFGKEVTVPLWKNPEYKLKAQEFAGIPDKDDYHYGISNINFNITDLVRKFPNTKFIFYIAPISILAQHDEMISRRFKYDKELKRHLVKSLSKYSNAIIYDFEILPQITYNLSFYKDQFHFCPQINDTILLSILKNKYICNESNIDNNISILEDQLSTVNIDSLIR